jgi:hypothetical protein
MRVPLRRPPRLAALTRGHAARSGERARARPIARDAASGSGADERRARTSGGPEDSALYSCECGCAFQAPVSASVSCPRCGSPQAW